MVIPKTNFESRSLTHYLLTDSTLIKANEWNIPEPVEGIVINPEQLDVIFIPLLAYDLKGNRVGYGKGFYDGFLDQCQSSSLKIGLSFFGPEVKIDDVYERDIPLDFCVTPDDILQF